MKGFSPRRSRSKTQARTKNGILRIRKMYDEMDRLREVDRLQQLLQRYQDLAPTDRLVWLDRVSELEGCQPRELVKLHGELLAYGWVELNTGETPNLQKTAAPASYRISSAGVRALNQLQEELELID